MESNKDVRARIRKTVEEDILKRRDYNKKYFLKNKEEIRAYKTAWAREKRTKRFRNFTVFGFVYKDGTFEITNIGFYKPVKK